MIPENVAAEIAAKRNPNAEDGSDNADNKDKKPESKDEGDKSKKSDKKEDAPENKGKAAKPKNGQSIAQVAEAADDEDEDEDEDEDDSDDSDEDEEDKPKSKKRSSLFKEFMDIKRELKDQKKLNKVTSQQYTELAGAMTELISVVKSQKGDKSAQRDEIEEFAEEWGLDKEGTKKLVNMLEKRLSTKFKPTKEDEEDEEEEDEKPKNKKSKSNDVEKSARKIEIAIESAYEDFIDSYPQIKDKINLKAVKLYIMSDDENLTTPFHDVVKEMYPALFDTKGGVDGGSDAGNDGEDDGDTHDWNDPKVMKEVEKNPKLREKYHNDIVSRLRGVKKQ